jgi:hypothetical protein
MSRLVAQRAGGYNPPQMLIRHSRLLRSLVIAAVLTLSGCALATKAPPRAYAGPDITVHLGETVSFDGSQSVDLDGGRIVYYQWRVAAAPEGREDEVGRVLHEGEDAASTTDTPMQEEDLGQWIIELKVTDEEGQSATDDLTLTVVP